MSEHFGFGRSRVMITNITPLIDNGRFPIKRIVNEDFKVELSLIADGHDEVAGAIAWRKVGEANWQHQNLSALEHDQFSATISFSEIGLQEYKFEAWIDHASTWLKLLLGKYEQRTDVQEHLKEGIEHLEFLSKHGISEADEVIRLIEDDPFAAAEKALEPWLKLAIRNYPNKQWPSESKIYHLQCDRKKAGFSTWYQMFPRGAGENLAHGTFKDVEQRLGRISDLGFDVLYLSPIHPIGTLERKGKNNSTIAQDGDVGSPWAVGSELGGHRSIHPELGSLEDYQSLINNAQSHGLEIAFDLVFQVAPDHPWLKENPQWFKQKKDGSIDFAENPPYKYQDVLPLDFESKDYEKLWKELLNIIEFWVGQGVKIFSADNPHTKSIPFWNWAIHEIQKKHPEVIFVAKAFTKPSQKNMLAKAGFNQSYAYYTWKNFRHELIEYMQNLTSEPKADFFRPIFWTNTPDILPFNLQAGHISVFMSRLFMAGTLSSNYGIYGPVYENMIIDAVPGKEEYLNSEKYEIQSHNWEEENKLSWLMRTLNKARQELSPLQQIRNFQYLEMENQSLFAFLKWAGSEQVVCVVNLDPYNAHEGWLQLPLEHMPLRNQGYRLYDYISGAEYSWREEWNYVRLDPARPFHLFKVVN